MSLLLEIVVGTLTLGLPLWFLLLDQGVFPKLKWVEDGEPPPFWGSMVVVVGVALAILIALASPFTGFHPSH